MGIKCLSLKQTTVEFAATLPIDRARNDVLHSVGDDQLLLEVYHRNMQDSDYLINTNAVRVRNVSDRYCFFKALLNTLRLEGS